MLMKLAFGVTAPWNPLLGNTRSSTLKFGRPLCIRIFTGIANFRSSISPLYVSPYISFHYLSYKCHQRIFHWRVFPVWHFLFLEGFFFFLGGGVCASFARTSTKNYLDGGGFLSRGRNFWLKWDRELSNFKDLPTVRVQTLVVEKYDSIHPLIKTKDLISALLNHKIMCDPYRGILTPNTVLFRWSLWIFLFSQQK